MPLKSSISSHVRISYRFYEFVTTRYTTDFYIIKENIKTNQIRHKYVFNKLSNNKTVKIKIVP